MRTRNLLAASTVIGSAILIGPLASPASAAVTATSSGTVVTVTMTGNGSAQFACNGTNKVAVNLVQVAPAVACSALTQVTVNGDSGNQGVYGSDLVTSTFAAGPKLVASMNDGSDYVIESRQADQIDLGPGDDAVVLFFGGSTNSPTPNLGTGANDSVTFNGTALDDSIAVTSTGASVTGVDAAGMAVSTVAATGAEALTVYAGEGDDVVNTNGVTAGSTLVNVAAYGEAGDDELRSGVKGSYSVGGDGTNTFIGGSGQDAMHSSSTTDIIDPGDDAALDTVYDDADSLHAGGRTLTHLKSADVYSFAVDRSDAIVRIRPGPSAGTTLATMSVTKFGQQVLPNTLGYGTVPFGFVGRPKHRVVLDAVAGGIPFNASTFDSDQFIADITVPSGSWTVNTGAGYVQIVPTDPAYKYVSANGFDAYRVHGPWADRNKGFVHRVTRDLMFRFTTSDAARDALAGQLAAHTTTRAAIISTLMGTDEYRGLDVDRVFLDYLRRVTDPTGRSYWINSLRNGKPLIKFRAQLFGSNEYFNKAGGTNEQYMVKAYADVLGRLPDPSGQTYWTNKLNNGAERGSVALQFLASTEARRNIVKNQFLRFVDRLPTTSEATTWVTNLSRPHGEEELIAFLGASGAYYDRS